MKHRIKIIAEYIFNQKIRKYSYKYRLGKLIKELNLINIIDVGANSGQFVLWANSLFLSKKTTVFSFEPLSSAYKELRVNSFKFRNKFVWKVYSFALSNEDGSAKINISVGDGTSSSLHELSDKSKVRNIGIEEVNLKAFDGLDDDFSDLDDALVKIDVQGHEMNVLQGMNNFINNKRPVIIIEIANVSSYKEDGSFTEYLKYFENAQYRLLWIEHNITDAIVDREWDLCFVPKEKFMKLDL
jgi:FkbM family methyltransferase